MADIEKVLDDIHKTLTEMNTDFKLTMQKLQIIDEQGCRGSMKKIEAIEKRAEENKQEHIFLKAVAYTSGLFGIIVYTAVGLIYYIYSIIK